MVVVRLMGGLGNQMFQYAIGRRLALENQSCLFLDTSFYEEAPNVAITARNFGLRGFQTKGFTLPTKLAKTLHRSLTVRSGLNWWETQLSRRIILVDEESLDFDLSVLRSYGNIYLTGYWQSEKYFSDIANIIRSDFKLCDKMASKLGLAFNFNHHETLISIHVRRGDYVTNPCAAAFHGICSIEWYRRAISLISNKTKAAVFLIFSDDLAWCKANFNFLSNVYFVERSENLTDQIELVMMSRCDHHIIANSSFSWWGAWLNDKPNKLVIAPKQWFSTMQATSDRIPGNWLLI